MLSKDEIIARFLTNHVRMAGMVADMNETDFSATLDGKWSAGQQLDHIYRSLKPLTMALGLPKIAVKILIGTANRPSKDYEGLVEKYHAVLAGGATATGAYVPKKVLFENKVKLAEKVRSNVSKLASHLAKYSEQDLDQYILPHPLLGKLTVREMLFFTIYHSEHHYKVTMQNLGK